RWVVPLSPPATRRRGREPWPSRQRSGPARTHPGGLGQAPGSPSRCAPGRGSETSGRSLGDDRTRARGSARTTRRQRLRWCMPTTSLLRLSLTLCAVSWGAAVAQAPIEVAALTFKDVATILHERCVLCHQGDVAPLGLRLDSFAGLMTGSERGPVVTPGEPDESEIIRRLEGSSLPRMPLTGPPFLDDAQIALVRQWIAAGAQEGVQASPEAPVTASDRPTDPGVT